jgi:hypothetical protein
MTAVMCGARGGMLRWSMRRPSTEAVRDALVRAIEALDREAARDTYRRQGEFVHLERFLPPAVKRFVSDMKDAISYFGFREVFRRNAGAAGATACSR